MPFPQRPCYLFGWLIRLSRTSREELPADYSREMLEYPFIILMVK